MRHFGLGTEQHRPALHPALLRAGGFNDDNHSVTLGSPDFLAAARRRRIIKMHDERGPLAEGIT